MHDSPLAWESVGVKVQVNIAGSWPFGDRQLYVQLLLFHVQDVTLFCEFGKGLMSVMCVDYWGLTSCCMVAFQLQKTEICLCSWK